MFEGDSADTYARKFPLVAPGSAHARPSARPPIGASRNFFLSSAAVTFVPVGVIVVFQNVHGVLSHQKIRFGVKKIRGTPHPLGGQFFNNFFPPPPPPLPETCADKFPFKNFLDIPTF